MIDLGSLLGYRKSSFRDEARAGDSVHQRDSTSEVNGIPRSKISTGGRLRIFPGRVIPHLIRDNPDCGTKWVIATCKRKEISLSSILHAESRRENRYVSRGCSSTPVAPRYRRVINRRSQLSFHGTVWHGGSYLVALFYQRRWRTARRTARRTAAAHAAADKDVRSLVTRTPRTFVPKEEALLARRLPDKGQRGVCLSSSARRRVGKEVSIRRAGLNNSRQGSLSRSFNAGTQFVSSCAMHAARRALLLFT